MKIDLTKEEILTLLRAVDLLIRVELDTISYEKLVIKLIKTGDKI